MYLTIAHLDFISPTSKSKILRKWDTLGRPGNGRPDIFIDRFLIVRKNFTRQTFELIE